MRSSRPALLALALSTVVLSLSAERTQAAAPSGQAPRGYKPPAPRKLPPVPASLRELDVPLKLREVAGAERKGDVCSTGVPMPCGLLREPQGIAVFDPAGKALPAQFRVLERWHEKGLGKDDGSVKWLLVTFLADVPAKGEAVYRLKAGRNPAPAAPVKIEDKGGAYEMGGLAFKKDFTSPFRLVLTDPDGKEIGTEGQEIKWSVWEEGPVRACLKAESPTDHGKFGFIAWVYAYSDQRRWDMTVVLKNTPKEPQGPFHFKDFSVVWAPPELAGATDCLFGGDVGKAARAAAPAHLYQDSDGTPRWDKPGGYMYVKSYSKLRDLGKPEFRGYRVLAGGKESGAGDAALGWAALNSGGAGGLACTRFFRENFPKAVEVAPGKIVVRLWPKYWKAHDGLHWLDDLSRKAHDLSFRLADGPVSAADGDRAAGALDAPLVAHCGLDWYALTGACDYLSAQYAEVPTASIRRPEPPKVSNWFRGWVVFGGNLELFRRRYHDYPMEDFICTADPYRAYTTYIGMQHSAGMTPLWLDDYQYPRDRNALKPTTYMTPCRDLGKYREGTEDHGYRPWNQQHFCCRELADAWRLFGDPLALDAVNGVAKYIQFYIDWRKEHLPSQTRCDALPMNVLTNTCRVTRDEAFLKSLREMADIQWKQIDKQQGFYLATSDKSVVLTDKINAWAPKNGKVPFSNEDNMNLNFLADALYEYYCLSADERALDMITGATDFNLESAYVNEKLGFVRHLPVLDMAVRAEYLEAYRQKATHYDAIHMEKALGAAYFVTGERRYKEWMERVLSEVAGGYFRLYPLTCYALEDPRTDREAPATVTDLKAEALGGGRVKLTWTAPAGDPARYQVKWAERPMVERLKWPDEKDTRSNWWAAENVPNEPAPSAGKQEMTVEGVSPGKRFFAVRSFDAASNRSAIGNAAEVDVR